MRAYSSFAQLEEKGIHVDEYHFMEQEGAFQARLDFKRWGKAKIFWPTLPLKTAVRW